MIFLEAVGKEDLEKVRQIQKAGFEKLYRTYKDQNSPYNETRESLLKKLSSRNNYLFLVKKNEDSIGYIRVITNGAKNQARIAPIVLRPEYENLGLGSIIMQLIEAEFNTATEWHLGTILQEKKLVHFYTKLGYQQQDMIQPIQAGMDEVFFIKTLTKSAL